MAPLKVIGAGCGRTGTWSLKLALDKLGYTTNHAKSFINDLRLDPNDFIQAHLDKENADWDKLYEFYDAAVDWPTVDFYKELHKRYPDMKVILTIRSPESWYESIKNALQYSFQKPRDVESGCRMEMFLKMCTVIPFDGILADPKYFEDKEKLMKLFNDHNEEVKRVIPASHLYIMELGSGWEGLCKFLDKDIPNEPYPRTNSTKEFKELVDARDKLFSDADTLGIKE